MGAEPTHKPSPTLARKQREYRQREQQILDVARDMLVECGIVGTSMERIAETMAYSRGTIYQHFSCKEEVILALAIETTKLRLRLYERVKDFRARPRERMVALSEVTRVLYPRHVHSELLVFTNALRAKTSPEQEQRLAALEAQSFARALDIVREAVAVGDLTLPEGMTPEAFLFGIWSILFGGYALMRNETCTHLPEVDDSIRTLRTAGRLMLDGFGWRPLSTEWDYRTTMKRIYTEVFPPEVIEALA